MGRQRPPCAVAEPLGISSGIAQCRRNDIAGHADGSVFARECRGFECNRRKIERVGRPRSCRVLPAQPCIGPDPREARWAGCLLLDIARRVGVLTLPVVLGLTGWVRMRRCQRPLVWTTALVFAGAGLRLGALGTQHVALYQQRPHLNLISATAEAVTALAALLLLLPRLGLPALGWALLAGGALRVGIAFGLERHWLAKW